jgi:hypothetical protein
LREEIITLLGKNSMPVEMKFEKEWDDLFDIKIGPFGEYTPLQTL